jgi:F-type H+-transporting ATPase subunit gamma
MTRLRDLRHQRLSLVEIRDILNSMKSLAYMETHKLQQFLENQRSVVASIEAAALDLIDFYPGILPGPRELASVFILIGTERGFCGDFNRQLSLRLETELARQKLAGSPVLAVGHKLHSVLQDDSRVVAFIEGVSVVEEIPQLLRRIVDELMALQQRLGDLVVYCVFHRGQDEIDVRRLLPPFQSLGPRVDRPPFPPQLNLPPRAVLTGLSEHYVLAALHEMLYTALSAENVNRISHLEGAVKHLDDKVEELMRKSRSLRQEEIVEEIEVMLLNVSQGPGQALQTRQRN